MLEKGIEQEFQALNFDDEDASSLSAAVGGLDQATNELNGASNKVGKAIDGSENNGAGTEGLDEAVEELSHALDMFKFAGLELGEVLTHSWGILMNWRMRTTLNKKRMTRTVSRNMRMARLALNKKRMMMFSNKQPRRSEVGRE